MPNYEYVCRECGYELEMWQNITDPMLQTMVTEHDDAGPDVEAKCYGTLDKTISKFGIGRVNDAGGSPGRQS